ncbi:MAG: phosphodiester glycosidase family protein [Cyanobacteria bacterium J06555_13]
MGFDAVDKKIDFVSKLLPRFTMAAVTGLFAFLGAISVGGGIWYASQLMRRPARSPVVRSLFQGVVYERYVQTSPRPLLFHVVSVDLTHPGIDFLVTPPAPNSVSVSQDAAKPKVKVPANTVPDFLVEHGAQVAVNGSYFSPHHVKSPWHYYPQVGELVYPQGVSIANGKRYSSPAEGWAALCVLSVSDIRITEGDCPPGTQQGLAGDVQFVKNGQLYTDGLVILKKNPVRLMPRSAIAIDKANERLWIVVVDGRQKGYSEGITLAELSEFVIALGADRALNLDGGGSSTLAIDSPEAPTVLNAPIQARVPMRLRPVANHFGIYAQPLSPQSSAPP